MLEKLIAVLAFSTLALPAFAATPQQEKMKACNTTAAEKSLSGDERKKFMSECLSADADEKGGKQLTAQQQKMKTCNADAKKQALKGDARKKFMSECLSKS